MKDDFEKNTLPGVASPPVPSGKRPVITLDVALFERYLEDGRMSDSQKREFLEALWAIIVGFVDLGFAVDPVEQAQSTEDCGQVSEAASVKAASLVSLTDRPENAGSTLNQRADTRSARQKGGRT